MLGRKIATYSKRTPFAINRPEEANAKNSEPNTGPKDNVPYEEQLLCDISASIKKLDIEPLQSTKSRKSEIRPRMSIAPSTQEFSDLLKECLQDKELPFEDWLTETMTRWPTCIKIGESSFSEVFKMSAEGDDSIAVKIMPLMRPGQSVEMGCSDARSPEPIQLGHLLHEIRSLQALETLRVERKYAIPSGHTGFNKMVRCAVVSGKYPKSLINTWDDWTAEHESYNDKPGL
ncbi:Serine/threonine-protein kinase haspin [Paramicrosporidium saccamoebae]|uniref:Serine/threonine-protein kinase haspin n=1 Tax=Paramicrosporidium saccamoebae TaxID=1246581 RepID=A0A2H9TIG8_9FUNG|nr:Serine/threonine-protein kinase haspin [Paramicrosporidium saccamoebae]